MRGQLAHGTRGLAGKIHALLSREHTKGRDLFDLAWYLTHQKRPRPNFKLPRNALAQTGWRDPALGPASWRRVLARHVASLDRARVKKDVLPFLEDMHDEVLLDGAMLLRELKRPG